MFLRKKSAKIVMNSYLRLNFTAISTEFTIWLRFEKYHI